ncbi:unnamed protein product [Ectocarpus sp. 13 AM-2016]
MTTEGRTRCLDAFVVALSQACEGGKKRWYASTLELQLTSLDMCRACRSRPILHLRVFGHTPKSLWSPHITRWNKRSSKLRISSRLSVVRALHLTWALSMEALLRKAAIEHWSWSQRLELLGSQCACRLRSEVVWPRGLTPLILYADSDISLENMSWPVR